MKTVERVKRRDMSQPEELTARSDYLISSDMPSALPRTTQSTGVGLGWRVTHTAVLEY
jgi:hypothetical protein